MDYKYDAGDGRYKHKWKREEAGFEKVGNGFVGKCDCSITMEIAETELNRGIPVFGDGDHYPKKNPKKIYALHRGVIYEAVPTIPGKSYHAYPWRGDVPGRTISRHVLEALKQLAEKRGELGEFKKWLKKFGM